MAAHIPLALTADQEWSIMLHKLRVFMGANMRWPCAGHLGRQTEEQSLYHWTAYQVLCYRFGIDGMTADSVRSNIWYQFSLSPFSNLPVPGALEPIAVPEEVAVADIVGPTPLQMLPPPRPPVPQYMITWRKRFQHLITFWATHRRLPMRSHTSKETTESKLCQWLNVQHNSNFMYRGALADTQNRNDWAAFWASLPPDIRGANVTMPRRIAYEKNTNSSIWQEHYRQLDAFLTRYRAYPTLRGARPDESSLYRWWRSNKFLCQSRANLDRFNAWKKLLDKHRRISTEIPRKTKIPQHALLQGLNSAESDEESDADMDAELDLPSPSPTPVRSSPRLSAANAAATANP